ncbi:uncharacterized protein TNCV_4652561 [Trichonephila clavipes]|nr:uncharacterized protein TNCV_4652561 [Trichonephila clavipes]
MEKQIRDADERRKKLEQQKLAAATELQAKQEEIKTISNEAERQKAMENIQNLESEIRELGKKCDLESVLREELSLEIQTLQRSQSKSSWNVQPVTQETGQGVAEFDRQIQRGDSRQHEDNKSS